MAANTRATNNNLNTTQRRFLFGAALKAGIWGGIAVSLLLIVYQIAEPIIRLALIVPAIIIVWIVTGIGAAMLSGSLVKTSRRGFRIGVVAGLVAGVVGGIAGMLAAAFGSAFHVFGQGILIQMADEQTASMMQSGVSESLLITVVSVISALFACGIGGMIVAALFGGFGGWLYPRFNR